VSKYRLTPQAVSDIFSIWRFIAEDNPAAADRVEQAIFKACDLVASGPLIGRPRTDLTSLPVRFWVVQPFPSYLIVYRADRTPVEIIRVLHTARDLPSLLR
jgi:antitoxin ParD1/3/4